MNKINNQNNNQDVIKNNPNLQEIVKKDLDYNSKQLTERPREESPPK